MPHTDISDAPAVPVRWTQGRKSTAWLLLSIFFTPALWLMDVTAMSLFWVARPPMSRPEKRIVRRQDTATAVSGGRRHWQLALSIAALAALAAPFALGSYKASPTYSVWTPLTAQDKAQLAAPHGHELLDECVLAEKTRELVCPDQLVSGGFNSQHLDLPKYFGINTLVSLVALIFAFLIVSLLTIFVSKSAAFMQKNDLIQLPAHHRRGVLRLYIVASALWVIPFWYRIAEFVMNHSYWHWRNISVSFWWSMAVPAVSPVIIWTAYWVKAGFGSSKSSAIDEAQRAQPAPAGKSFQQKTPDYMGIGKNLGAIFAQPTVWRDSNMLQNYQVPDAVARYEVAFARVAIIRDAVARMQPKSIAHQMLEGINLHLKKLYKDDLDIEAINYYKNAELANVAERVIRIYENNVFPLTKLASVIASRLSIVGMPEVAIAALFNEVEQEAENLMKLSTKLQKIGA